MRYKMFYVFSLLALLFFGSSAYAQSIVNQAANAYFLQPTASDNNNSIKRSPGIVYGITAFNNSATVNYIRLYNSADPAFDGCNAATNLVIQYQVPASTAVGGFVINHTPGISFSNGIAICVTSGYATNDTTNATATAMSITVSYK